ncbi:hypothetical protein ANN_10170 [Periplaneta americana]|uniref:Reverse transcriptase domain-containing protein n=1 Tax=Periplaneta americana TaxID=6978 RepID=A0ABQ8TR27_PERAM|nr:hypothetical protein ANN_10170 [Periplaneta americana]
MSSGSSTDSYPAFAHVGLRKNPGKNLNQITCPDRKSNPGHLVSQPDALNVTPQCCLRNTILLAMALSEVNCHNPGDPRNETVRLTRFLEFGKDAATLPPRGFDGDLSIFLNEGCDWLLTGEDKIPVTGEQLIRDGHESYNSRSSPGKRAILKYALRVRNFTRIHSSNQISDPIVLQKGVFQGSPLSPLIFNMSIDFILKELTEKQVSDKFGFEVSENLDNLTMPAFADDLVVIGKDMSAAQDLVLMVKELLEGIGLHINPNKSTSIDIVKGKLCEEDLILYEDCSIRGIKQDETIRYLGLSFNGEITFDREAFVLV